MSGKVIKIGTITIIAFFMGALCLLFPAISANGAREGLIICGNVVIPSLFPFCVLALFCFKSGIIGYIARFLSPFSKRIFHLSGEQFCVLIMSCLAGYPVGIKLIKTLCAQDAITAEQAKRMSLYCINAGPAFILTAVGEGMLGNRYYGRILLFANLMATLIICFVTEVRQTPPVSAVKKESTPISDAFVDATADAAKSIFGICGWVVLFSSILSIINCGVLPENVCKPLEYLFEVTTAAMATKNILLISAILSFCGLCVHCQVYSVGKGATAPYGKFLLFRAFHASISVLITYIFLKSDNRAIHTISNNISTVRNNVSFTYTSAIALIILSLVLCVSVSDRKNLKFM